jgi:hypothetical protein
LFGLVDTKGDDSRLEECERVARAIAQARIDADNLLDEIGTFVREHCLGRESRAHRQDRFVKFAMLALGRLDAIHRLVGENAGLMFEERFLK